MWKGRAVVAEEDVAGGAAGRRGGGSAGRGSAGGADRAGREGTGERSYRPRRTSDGGESTGFRRGRDSDAGPRGGRTGYGRPEGPRRAWEDDERRGAAERRSTGPRRRPE